MPSFARLVAVASIAAVASANVLPTNIKRVAEQADCANPEVITEASIPVGDKIIEFKTVSCGTSAKRDTLGVDKRGLLDQLLCHVFNTCKPPPPTPPQSVCGINCTTTCSNDAGVLPPISEDCDTIENAIQIFAGNIPDSFTVAANTIETLTFGTCSYFFKNTYTKDLAYCWSGLSTVGSAAGSACFPPVQPVKSQGYCASADGRWGVGAAHS